LSTRTVRKRPQRELPAKSATQAAGMSPNRAPALARRGGLYSLIDREYGARVQCIWRTCEGGNHFDDQHTGVRPL
jgi:hypothetical protein